MVVSKLEIAERGLLQGGREFGEGGKYEYLSGIARFEIDPRAEVNEAISDLDLAPTNDKGLVEFSSQFHLLKPLRPIKDGRLLVDSPNRGNMTGLWMFNGSPFRDDASADVDPGNGFLMRHGYCLLTIGIQCDVPRSPERIRADFPEATHGARRLEGPAFIQWWGHTRTFQQLLSDAGHEPYPTADLEDQRAVLTVRDHHDGAPTVIPREQWHFARLLNGNLVPDVNYCYLSRGFQPGKIYELTYTALGAPIIGLGFVGFRDIASFLKYGSTGNPLTGALKYAYGWGHSMNGRWLREFLFLGLNQDEQGRMVYDGLLPHTGSSRRGEFNLRFGQPSTNILRSPGSTYPFAFEATPEPRTGESRGLLRL